MLQEQCGRAAGCDWTKVLVKQREQKTRLEAIVRDNAKYEENNARLEFLKNEREYLRESFNRLTEIYKDVQKNLADKKRNSLQEFNDAITEASYIVKDSEMGGVHLAIDGGKASILNENKEDINDREGGAQRVVLGFLLRYMCIAQTSDAIPLILLDEGFFAVSDNTSQEMVDCIAECAKHFLIIGIEQRASIFASVDNKVKLLFQKDPIEKETHVREVS